MSMTVFRVALLSVIPAASTTITPTVVAVSVTVPTPTITASATITPTVVAVSVTVPTPTVVTGTIVTPTVVAVLVTVPTPTVTAGVFVPPTVVAVSTTVPTPTITASATITPTVVAVSVTVPTPTISDGTAATTYHRRHIIREPRSHVVRESRMAAAITTTYRTVDEDPGIAYDWLDRDGATIDCSAATWSMVIYNQSGTVVSTKTSGVLGDDALPNVVVTWSAGELAAIGAGRYTYKLSATISARERTVNPGTTHSLIIV